MFVVFCCRRSPPARPGSLTHTVHANASGRVHEIDIAQISEIARRAGAPVDKSAGIDLAARVGGEIRRDDVLYTIHASAAADLEAAAAIADLDAGVH